MTLLVGLVAQLLHVALIGAAAPTLIGLHGWLQARLAGRVGASPLQPWRELIRLSRKQTVLSESASGVTTIAPVACIAATAIAAFLVPSFALGMVFSPLADLLLIVGLLMAARGSLALAAMDAGTAQGGMAASRAMLLTCLTEPALLLVLFVLALLAGSLNLDLIAAMQMENGIGWRTGVGIALAATLLMALVDTMRHDGLALDLGGPDMALVEAADALRLLVWFNLIGALCLPFGMATSDAGPAAWFVGLVSWLARTALFALGITILRVMQERLSLPRAAGMLGVAMLLGVVAIVLLFSTMRTA